jgi:hypothetical protein
MPIDYTKIAEGDRLDAASLNDRFDEIAGQGPDRGVNNLGQEDLERFALRKEHLPPIINTSDFPNGMCKLGPAASTPESYDSELNLGGLPVGYLTIFGALGANPPYGPPPALDSGWRIPAAGGVVADAAELDVGLARSADQLGDYRGILVRLGISLNSCGQPGGASMNNSAPSVVIGIGWEDDLGARQVIERSIRWFHVCSRIKGSLDTFTFIRAEDVPAGRTIDKVFGVISAGIKNNLLATDTPIPIIDFYHIDIIPVRYGDM